MKVCPRKFLYLKYFDIFNTNGKWFSGPQHKPWNTTNFLRSNNSFLNPIPIVHINQMAKRCTGCLLTIKRLRYIWICLYIRMMSLIVDVHAAAAYMASDTFQHCRRNLFEST